MGWKDKLLGFLRLGAALAGDQKIKGVPISVIAEEAEKDGKVIADSVKRIKAVPKKPAPPSDPGA